MKQFVLAVDFSLPQNWVLDQIVPTFHFFKYKKLKRGFFDLGVSFLKKIITFLQLES